jgi:hypothetical protein
MTTEAAFDGLVSYQLRALRTLLRIDRVEDKNEREGDDK